MTQNQFQNEARELQPKLMSTALALMHHREDAEDVVQECLLKLWQLQSRYAPEHLHNLAFVITRHLCINRLRHKSIGALQPEELPECIDPELNPEERLIDRKQTEMLLTLVDELPDLQRTVLRLHHAEGLEVEEIARLTAGTAGSVRTNLSRARRTVWTRFEKMDK